MPLRILSMIAALSLGASAARRTSVAVREPRRQGSAARMTAASVPSCGTSCKTLYYGGKVIPNAKVYVVNWTSAVAPGGDLGAFYNAVTNSTYLDWLNEYDTPTGTGGPTTGTNQFIGRGVYGGTFTIAPSSANASGTCPTGNLLPPPGTTVCLTDAQVQSELNAQIAAGHLPPSDENALYMTYFPPHTFIAGAGSGSCISGGFCGYHSTWKDSTREFYYGVLPDHGPGSGCDAGCGSHAPFDNLTSTSAHELCEAITDAEVGIVTNTSNVGLGWYDDPNGEIGDMCNSTSSVAGFTVQDIFSNLVYATGPGASACVSSRTAANDFSVSLASNKKKISGGGSIAVPITTTVTAGSIGTLTLSVSGLPAHVIGVLDHPTVAAGNGAVLTLTADSSAPAATNAVVQIKAAAGSNIHTAGLLLDVAPGITAGDFALSISAPAAGTIIPPGSSADYTVNTSAIGGFAKTITLSLGTLPTGVTGTLSSTTVAPGASSTLHLTAGTAAVPSTTFTVTGTASGVSAHGATSIVGVGAAAVSGDFILTLAPPADLHLAPGGSADWTIDTAVVASAAAEQIALTVGTLPPGVHASLLDATVTAGGSTTLTLSVDSNTANIASRSFTVTGAAASGSRAATGSFDVVGPNLFSLSLTPSSRAIAANGKISFTVQSAVVTGDASESISLSAATLPGGVTGVFTPSVIHAGDSATLTLSADATVVADGPVSFEVDGSSISDFEYATANLAVVAADFTLLLSPATSTVAPGGHATFTVNATATTGAPANLALSVLGALPTGLTASFSPGTIATLPFASTLTLTAAGNTPLSTAATFTVQGIDDNGVPHTATAQIAVVAVAFVNDFSLSLAPALVAAAPGHSVPVQITTTLTSGAAESIALSASGLPAGVTASFNPATVTAGGASTMTLAALFSTAAVPDATYTVTGAAASFTHSVHGALAINPAAFAPIVSLTHPAAGATVSGAVEIDAAATPGAGASLLKVELLVDGILVASVPGSPAQGFWQSAEGADGPHVLTARAVDSSGGSTLSAPVSVTSHNAFSGGSSGGSGGGCASSGASLSALFGLLITWRRRRVT